MGIHLPSSLFLALLVALILVFVLVNLRNRKLREKYVIFWLIVGLCVLVLALFPSILFWAANVVGIAVPANLLFLTAIIGLIMICLHLSVEISNLEDETRILAEEVTMLRAAVEKHTEYPNTTTDEANQTDEVGRSDPSDEPGQSD